MPASLNRVILLGNLCRDPETKTSPGGSAICSLRLAVNERVKELNSGQWQEQPGFFDITTFGALAEQCAKYLAKGRPIAVDGRLRYREWQSEGRRHSAVSVAAEHVQFLGAAEHAPATTSKAAPGARPDDSDIPS